MKYADRPKLNISGYVGPWLRRPVLTRRPNFRIEILLAIQANQLEEIAQRKRADQQAEQAEVAHAADRADQRDERMNRGKAAIDQRPNEVVDAADYHDAPHDDQDPRNQAALHDQNDGGRNSH